MKQVRKKDTACKYGKMVIIMMGTMKGIKLMVRGSFSLLMETCIMENGLIIKHMDKVHILNSMGISMKGNLYRIYNKDTARKLGRTVLIILVIFIME